MKKKEMFHNFIVYLFVLVSFIVAVGYGFGEECQFFSSVYSESESSVNAPTFLVNEGLHTVHVRKCNTNVLRFRVMNDTRSEVALRSGFVFLSILAILSVFFRFIHRIIIYYRRLYVLDRYVVVWFIHNKDGRKRLA